MLPFQRHGITMVHGVESSVVSDPAFYARMLAFVQPQLEFLGPIIAEHYARKMVGYALRPCCAGCTGC